MSSKDKALLIDIAAILVDSQRMAKLGWFTNAGWDCHVAAERSRLLSDTTLFKRADALVGAQFRALCTLEMEARV